MHWAIDLIGLPYKSGAQGPDAFDCWGFVRWVFKTQDGIEMPIINVGDTGNLPAIRAAAEAGGWHPVGEVPAADRDIALMDGPLGKHVGMVTRANGGLKLLHCVEFAGVALHTFPEAATLGFRNMNFWRRIK